MAAPTLMKDPSPHLHRRMRKVDSELERICEDVAGLEAESSVHQCLLRQLEKRTDGLMTELTDICRGILLLDNGSEELLDQGSSLKKVLYVLDLRVKQLLHEQTMSPKLISGVCTEVKLPKISVSIFDGDIMNWSSFWEQFCCSVTTGVWTVFDNW